MYIRSVVPGLNGAHSEVLRQEPADLSYLINERVKVTKYSL